MWALGWTAMYGGGAILEGQVTEGSEELAVEYFTKAATAGNTDAMFELALAYYSGHGVAKDRGEAVKWHERAALAGHTSAMTFYGNSLMSNGRREEGLLWLEKAATAGNAIGMYWLGFDCLSPHDAPRDPDKGIEWLTLAATQSADVPASTRAQALLGHVYDWGQGHRARLSGGSGLV